MPDSAGKSLNIVMSPTLAIMQRCRQMGKDSPLLAKVGEVQKIIDDTY